MRKLALGLLALSFAAAPAAFAQNSGDFASVDTDTNGEISFAEIQAVWPEATQEQFDAVDTDLNGALTDAEFDEFVVASGATTELTGQPISEADGDNDAADDGKAPEAPAAQ